MGKTSKDSGTVRRISRANCEVTKKDAKEMREGCTAGGFVRTVERSIAKELAIETSEVRMEDRIECYILVILKLNRCKNTKYL